MNTQRDAVKGKCILLVDDERVVREMIKLLLTQDDHLVVEANNGAEAYTIFTQGRFDLVLTDCEMPFVKGNELATRIRKVAPTQPILMITGFGHKTGNNNPVDAVLDKPFNLNRLRWAMAEVLADTAPVLSESDTDLAYAN